MADLKGLSKGGFDVTNSAIESIQVSCLMRIADASEAMAKNHIKLQNDYNYMKESRDSYRDQVAKLEFKIRTLKGNNTKLKKQIQQLKEPNSSNG